MGLSIAESCTIPELAKRSGINRRTLHNRLMKLHRTYGGDWLYRGRKKIRINPAALRAAHPAVFDPPDLVARVGDLEERAAMAEREIQVLARQVGAGNRRLKALEGQT